MMSDTRRTGAVCGVARGQVTARWSSSLLQRMGRTGRRPRCTFAPRAMLRPRARAPEGRPGSPSRRLRVRARVVAYRGSAGGRAAGVAASTTSRRPGAGAGARSSRHPREGDPEARGRNDGERCGVGSFPAAAGAEFLRVTAATNSLPPVAWPADCPGIDPRSGAPEAPVTPPGEVPLTTSVQRRPACQFRGMTSVTVAETAS